MSLVLSLPAYARIDSLPTVWFSSQTLIKWSSSIPMRWLKILFLQREPEFLSNMCLIQFFVQDHKEPQHCITGYPKIPSSKTTSAAHPSQLGFFCCLIMFNYLFGLGCGCLCGSRDNVQMTMAWGVLRPLPPNTHGSTSFIEFCGYRTKKVINQDNFGVLW